MEILCIHHAAVFMDGSLAGASVRSYGGWWGFAIMLLVYHVILAWAVFSSDKEKGLSLSIPMTVITHLSCLAVLVGLNIVGRHIPFFGIARYFIPALAPFERDWLFSGKTKTKKEAPAPVPITAAVAEATADDHAEWLRFVAQQRPPFPRPGTTLQAEYERWMAARAKSRRSAS